jgi:hypothetical protein
MAKNKMLDGSSARKAEKVSGSDWNRDRRKKTAT